MSASCTGSIGRGSGPPAHNARDGRRRGRRSRPPAQPGQCRAALLLGAEGFAKRLVAQPAHPRCNLEPHIHDLPRQKRTKNICLPKRSVTDKQVTFYSGKAIALPSKLLVTPDRERAKSSVSGAQAGKLHNRRGGPREILARHGEKENGAFRAAGTRARERLSLPRREASNDPFEDGRDQDGDRGNRGPVFDRLHVKRSWGGADGWRGARRCRRRRAWIHCRKRQVRDRGHRSRNHDRAVSR